MLSREETKEHLNNVADELNKFCRLVRNVGFIINNEIEVTEETKKQIAETISPIGDLFQDEKFQAITSAYHYLTETNITKASFTKELTPTA